MTTPYLSILRRQKLFLKWVLKDTSIWLSSIDEHRIRNAIDFNRYFCDAQQDLFNELRTKYMKQYENEK